jgi:enoyl-CoA hydratase/carnithine racemase
MMLSAVFYENINLINKNLIYSGVYFIHNFTFLMTASERFFIITRDSLKGKLTGVATIKFNRPQHLNALSVAMAKEFGEEMDILKQDTSIRSIILTGSGKAFSSGGDIKWLKDRTLTLPSENAKIMKSFYQSYLQPIVNSNVPVIASVNGLAIGAGACISLLCDIRLASNKAKFGFNFVNLGIPPGMCGSYTLPLLIGQQNANRLMLTGDIVDAKEARELGLVLQVYEHDELEDEALKLARKISSASPEAVKTTTKTLRLRFEDGAFERALQREADTQAICFAGADIKEGLDAITEKRQPDFYK